MEGCFGSAEIFSERNLRGIGRAAEPFRRNGAVAEPWKARKKWPPCHFLLPRFLQNAHVLLLTCDAPSMALLVRLSKKWKDVGLAKGRDGRAVGGIVLKITGGCVCTKVFFLV